MSDAREVTCRPRWTGALWILVGLGAAGTAAAVALRAYTGVHAWPAVGVLPALTGLVALWKCTARLRADARGLHSRTLLRRRSVPGDRVRLTLWRGEVKAVAGDRHTWRDHTAGVGDLAMVAAGLTLLAGYPAARMLLRVRSRRRPDGEVLPSALPFAAALAVTALWLLPLCYLHPTAPFASPTTTTWTALGTVTTLTLVVWAWRATRIRPPGPLGPPGQTGERLVRPGEPAEGEVFLPARFLEATAYNPHRFGTHVVVGGDGPPAVVPHSGPGRFAARPVPVSRLTLQRVRRARGDDPGVIPGDWHVAELDDAGTPVRLAAAPADLARILRELPARRTRPDQPSDLTAP
ncbi:hypothetical protein [Streptomyces sp. NPDC058726]|uniref:hypothetical protein n=1 Tax=Streptomyces sp. NPDC058726 TaxID=3346611 RepID=UPI003698692E